jgi:signal transduction histidine kinase
VRRRIVVLVVAAGIVAIAVFGLPLAGLVLAYVSVAETAEQSGTATVAALTVAVDLARGTDPQLPPVRSGTGTSGPGRSSTDVGLYDLTGRRITGTGPDTADAAVRQVLAGASNAAQDGVVAVPVLGPNDQPAGAVRVSEGPGEVVARVAWIWAAMLVLAAAAVLGAAAIAVRQGRRLAGPLEALSTAARRLGDGDFSARTERAGIPEIDSLGADLDTTAERLGTSLARWQAFSRDASHQLRTPLTGLSMTLETLLDDPAVELPPAAHDAVVVALRSADGLRQTIDDLLELARTTARPTTQVAVRPVVDDVLGHYRPLVTRAGRRVVVVADGRVPPAVAATAALRQIVTVLVDNALRHGSGTISVRLRGVGTAVAVEVGDEGWIVDPGGGAGGIGLSIARDLADSQGARLALTSADPTTFTLMLLAGDDG